MLQSAALEAQNFADNLLGLSLITASLNLFVPFFTNQQSRSRKLLLFLVSGLFFVNIIIIDWLYFEGFTQEIKLFTFDKYVIRFALEPMGIIFLNMLAILWNIALIYTVEFLKINQIKSISRFLFFLNACIICGICISLSANLFTMLVFYELLTLCTIPLIAHEPNKSVKDGLFKYLVVLMLSALILFLPAVIIIYVKIGHGEFIAGGILSNNFDKLYVQVLLLMFIFGIAKSALVPMHTWLPAAMVASYPVSALLHAVVVVKAGLFCTYKILVYTFGLSFLREVMTDFNWLIILPGITIMYSSLQAIRQKKIKIVLAYSTITQLSISLISAFLLTPKGISAALMHMVSHSFTKISLFYCAGAIYSIKNIYNISDLKGVFSMDRRIALMFTIAGLSLIGLPPFAGFISKFYIMLAAADAGNLWVVILVSISSVFSAIYTIKMVSTIYTKSEINKKTNIRLNKLMIFSIFTCILIVISFAAFIQFIKIFV